jgi:ADP-heptose:LPS heptosyltransferase
MTNTLTFRPGSIGDCLMAKYFLENVRAAHPGGRYTIAVSSRVPMLRDLFAAYPWIEIVETKSVGFARRNLVVTPYTGGIFPLRTKLFARVFAQKLIGYSDRSSLNHFLYDAIIPLVGRSRAPRLLECDALTVAGVPVTIQRPSFVYLPQPQLLERLGLKENEYALLHLFSGSNARGLSPKCKHELIKTLSTSLPVSLVLTGTKKETDSLGELPAGVRTVETSLQGLAHLIDHSRVIVSLDTGVAHMAAHLQKPLVVLASCVGVQWWGSDMYGQGIPRKLFERTEVCEGHHDYSGYAKCLEAIDMLEVGRAAAAI